MTKRRVVVTGMSCVSCFGMEVEHFYDQLLLGKSGVRPIESFDCSEYPTRFAATVSDFEVGDYLDKKQARRVDPFILYSVVAGKRALEHAEINYAQLSEEEKSRAGVIIGSGMGGMSMFYDNSLVLHEKGFKKITPFFVPFIITNMGSGLLGIELGFQGPNYSVSTACATATHSIHLAAKHVQNGDAEIMVAGGAEAPISPIGLAGFVACKALSERNDDPKGASRPWSKDRDGFVMGEGAGVLVLEEYEHAKKRGATIYAEYLGGDVNCDAYHITGLRPDGLAIARCVENGLKEANAKPTDVDYINAHATSTLAGDLCEIKALRSALGDHLPNVAINSTKSMTGHCLGAAGGVEAIATIMAIHKSKIHPTINLNDPEEELADLNLVPNEAQERDVNIAVNNSFGFGGHNACLVFGKCKE